MLFNVLSDEDKRLTYDYICRYADHESRIRNASDRASLETLLTAWSVNKQYLYEMFGNKLILKKDVVLSDPINLIADNISEDLSYNHEMYFTYDDMRDFACDHIELDYYRIMELFNSTMLANNIYTGETFVVEYNGKKITIQNGMKPVKAIGKLVNLFGLSTAHFERFRLAQSLHTNQRRLKGTLCLSIHPLDYMTMSDNDYDWSSCMSWQEAGCYCRGTVEMMNSKSVIVAYLEGEEPFEWSYGYAWNNKKWRQLFVVDNDLISGIKAYPYKHDDLTKMILEWLGELSYNKHGNKYTAPFEFENWSSESVVHDGTEYFVEMQLTTDTMYSDCDHNPAIGMINVNRLVPNTKICIAHNYSGPEQCMFCGSLDAEFDEEGHLLCSDCMEILTCDGCGDLIGEEEYYELDGNIYCEYCYEQHVRHDVMTDEDHDDANMYAVAVVPTDVDNVKTYHRYPSFVMWQDLLQNYNSEGKYYQNYITAKEIHPYQVTPWGYTRYYITVDELGEDAYELFEGDYNSNEELIKDIKEITEFHKER